MPLLDTDILIDVLRGFAPASKWFASLDEAPLVPGFVALELLQGCKNTRELQTVEAFLASLRVVWPSNADCEMARTAFGQLRLRYGIGILDALIAACAMGLGIPLCTFNGKHYRGLPGLVIITPYEKKQASK